jgi:hypothetical protein
MESMTVRKLDHAGSQVTAYPGRVLWRDDHAIVLRTGWERAPLDLGFVVLEPGDRWTEHFYADRWYNIFEIRASDGRLKGWYCNVTRPARISGGEMQVLDEDEFAVLPLTPAERKTARQALAELQAMVARGAAPFDRRDHDG